MNMKYSNIERAVGTFVVGVLLLLIATLVIIGRGKDWFEKDITFYTTFKESYNLQKNAAVKLFKTDIGRVKSITLDNNTVRVKLVILEKYASRIRQDAVAVVESPTFIGSEYVSILPGSPHSPLIPEQGEIASKEKRSISDILTEFEVEKTAKMVVKAIQDISEVALLLKDPQGPLQMALENIENTTTNIENMTTDIQAGKGPLGAALKSEDILGQILQQIDDMGNILKNIDIATAKAPKTMGLVQKNLTAFHTVSQSLIQQMDQIHKILEGIDDAAADLQLILKNIKAGSYHVPRISTSFRDGVEEIRDGVEQINRVVDALQKNIFIRSNLTDEPVPLATDADARP